ncbi:DUF5791 family protein [Halobacteria archaeon AArc-dxtr1]|nr:DUF5791 family protein [Halobacteria archaeon AArc-dxtr1]
MFYEQRRSVPASPAALRTEYAVELSSIVDDVGLEDVTAQTDIDRDRLVSIDDAELTLAEAAEIQSLTGGEPDPETIETIACEHLLLGMSSAVMDVDTLAAELDLALEPKEIQQKIERRTPMTFAEYVHLQYAIVDALP